MNGGRGREREKESERENGGNGLGGLSNIDIRGAFSRMYNQL